ncbi:MAG: hypothetical protein IT172_11555 [Acidobacteria bacterium]|nr:hypothetical protein [Acidobacteriota bacterium]MCO5334844.1 hypothetical protein [Pyrinomonadaceae bacterium]
MQKFDISDRFRYRKKGTLPFDKVPFLSKYRKIDYFFSGAVLFASSFLVSPAFDSSFFASSALLPVALLAGAAVAGEAGDVVVGVAGVVVAGVAGLAFAGFAFALFAGASPQANPRALTPKTVARTITFVILFKTPIFSKNFGNLFPGRPADRTQPFCPELFLFQGKLENRYYETICQPKMHQKMQNFQTIFRG